MIDELEPMLRKLINNGVPREKQKAIKELISNELFHYIEPQHRTRRMQTLILNISVFYSFTPDYLKVR